MSEDLLLFDILRGFSEINKDGKTFYLKHPTILDKLAEKNTFLFFQKRGRDSGLSSESELLDLAIKAGSWSNQNEELLKELEWLISKKEKVLETMRDPNMRESNKNSIKRDYERIADLKKEKADITKFSLENYVHTKIPLELCQRDVFIDPSFNERIKHEEARSLLEDYIMKYNELSDRDSLVRISYNNSFFDLIFIQSNNPLSIFGKNIYEITVFQKEILILGQILNSKLRNIPNIPDSVKKDAVKLYNYVEDKKEEKEHEEHNIRKEIQRHGSLEEAMKPENKIT